MGMMAFPRSQAGANTIKRRSMSKLEAAPTEAVSDFARDYHA